MRFFVVLLHSSLLLSLFVGCGETRDTPEPEDAIVGVPDLETGAPSDADIDGDGVPNEMDNCPSIANADQREACAFAEPPPPDPDGDVVADGLGRLNWHRSLVGLEPVVDLPEASLGCQEHVNYILRTAEDTGMLQLIRMQDPASPHYTEAGAAAGMEALLGAGQSSIGLTIDGWFNSLYTRLPLLQPGLARVGIGYEDGIACLHLVEIDASVTTAYPIKWPAPDFDRAPMTFAGNSFPCPTAMDPLAGGPCDFSGTIPSIGFHGLGALAGVMGTYTALPDDADPALLELFATYFDGGPSPHEMMGFLNQSAAFVPMPETTLDLGLYEVGVALMVGDAAQTHRWRFRTTPAIPGGFECDPTGVHRTIEDALTIRPGERIAERICDEPDMYFFEADDMLHRVEIHSDPDVSDLDMVAYFPDPDPVTGAPVEFARTAGLFPVDWLEVQGGFYLQVVGRDLGEGNYLIIVM